MPGSDSINLPRPQEPTPLRAAPGVPGAGLAFVGQALAAWGIALSEAFHKHGALCQVSGPIAVDRQAQLEVEVVLRGAKRRFRLGLVTRLEPVALDVVYVAQAQLAVALYFRFAPRSPVHHLLQADWLHLQAEIQDSPTWAARTQRWLERTFAPQQVLEQMLALTDGAALERYR